MDHGKIIVIEGLDGSGKNTQSKILVEKLRLLNKNVKMVSMPNYNSESSGPVRMYLNYEIADNPMKINPYASSSFFAVDRFINYFCDWKKFYQTKDSILICDRYSTSNMIYHLAKIKEEDWDSFLEWICTYEYKYLEIPVPDLVLYLRVPIDISQKLMENRSKTHDLHESNLEFLKLCKKSCEYVSCKFNWKIIDCYLDKNNMKPIKDISDQIFEYVKNII